MPAGPASNPGRRSGRSGPAELLGLLDEDDQDLMISDEDAAEIERRMNDPHAETISPEEFDRCMARWLD